MHKFENIREQGFKPMRPYWKGYLKLALVSCPIALHAACSSAERIALRQINKATGNRLRQQLIDEETREPVAPEHKGRGYEVAKGQYLIRRGRGARSHRDREHPRDRDRQFLAAPADRRTLLRYSLLCRPQ
jgi:Ku70/Ku80-like protein